jgi:Mlc titration factor MtfA (ptsG expression regulator)
MRFISRRAWLHSRVALGIAATLTIGLGFVLYRYLVWSKLVSDYPASYAVLVLIPVFFVWMYQHLHRKYIRRAKIYRTPFPTAWRQILSRYVTFYRVLGEQSKIRFEKLVQVFLSEHKIIGVGTSVDDLTKVLVAASAVIPTFGYVDWEYDRLGVIFIYPNRFDSRFNYDPETDLSGESYRQIAGMVGNEALLNAMILSKEDMIASFVQPFDGRNVPVHEFTHVIDKSDGAIDGNLSLYWDKNDIRAWRSLMYRETQRILRGETKIDPYAATQPVEFLAVMSEYFFELPEFLYHEHPEVYQLLKKGFRQDTRKLMADAPQARQYHAYRARLEALRQAENGVRIQYTLTA